MISLTLHRKPIKLIIGNYKMDIDLQNPMKLAGLILLLGSLIPFLLSVGVGIWGDMRSVEAIFRDIRYAQGSISSFRVMLITWALWGALSLAGFVCLALGLWNKGVNFLLSLSVIGLSLFTFSLLLETSFHLGVTSWAIRETEKGGVVPDIFFMLKKWLNYYMQIMANPLATLSYLFLGISLIKTHSLPAWSCRTLIIWSALVTLYPLPLAFAPIPLLTGVALLIWG